MVGLKDLIKISDYEWEIPRTFRQDMKVPVRIFATRKLIEAVMDDRSLEQAVNSATLPGLVGHVLVMPDMHQGYGFPIGGVAATRFPEGVISPGGGVSFWTSLAPEFTHRGDEASHQLYTQACGSRSYSLE